MQVFWFLSYFPEPLSLAAQSLIARDKGSPRKVAALSRILIRVTLALGALLSVAFIGILTVGVGLFTNDPLVAMEIHKVLLPALPCLVVISLVMICDGVSIGYSMYHILPRIGFLSLIGTASLLRKADTLSQIWWSMLAFFGMRLVLHGLFILRNWRSHPFGGLITSDEEDGEGLVKHIAPKLRG
jgi:Na+-driven multidrug efflux pump